MEDDKRIATSDVSLAAYIRLRGYQLIEYRLIKKGKSVLGEWIFDLDKETLNKLKIEYVNSEISEFEGIRRGMAKQKYE